LTAAETQIDVAGNNLANSQTVGFKASNTVFITQFLQTQSLGSAPSGTDGGTNPRQTGLGVRVGEISPNFTQGTIEVSSNPSDLAIQGDGFFIVQGSQGERLYTRNGIFKTNAENELTTSTGNLVLGFGVDGDYNISRTETLVPVTIPLGSKTVAKATENVTLEGILTPTGDVADTAGVIESAVLGDGSIARPDASAATATAAAPPNVSGVTVAHSEGPGTHPEGAIYQYKLVYVDGAGKETSASTAIPVTVPAGDTLANNRITLNNLPAGTADYANIRIYRATGTSATATFSEVGTVAAGGSFNDNLATIPGTPATLDNTTLTGNYTYMVTFRDSVAGTETRPSELVGPVTVVNGRVTLSNLPSIPPGTSYDQISIYRNIASDNANYFLVGNVNAPGGTPPSFTDSRSDASISDLTISGNKQVDLDGPQVTFSTRLVDILKRDGLNYENAFEPGTLTFQSRKGGRLLDSKEFTIRDGSVPGEQATTLADLLTFMNQAMGIQTTIDDPTHPIPNSQNEIPGDSSVLSPGATVTGGKIRVVSNNGVDNAIAISLSSFRVEDASHNTTSTNLGFGTVQDAKGQSAVADFVAYDSLGIPIQVRVTAVLQSISGTETTYRWFADSPQNQGVEDPPVDISVGTGLLTFDGEGNLLNATNTTVSIDRRQVPSDKPLEFDLDFSNVSGLAADKATLAATRQDGSAQGKLTSYIIGEDGIIRGVFSNGVTRDLGQLQLARFANPTGLSQMGSSMYAEGVNSGLPIVGDANQQGLGKIVAGARELSNTDIGKSMIELVLASTQYRSNSRVISTAQQLLDELLNLRR